MTTSLETQRGDMSNDVNDLYPGRVVYGSEELAAELSSFIGGQLLSAEGRLVIVLASPNMLSYTASGDPLALRIVNCIKRRGCAESFGTNLGSSYLTKMDEDATVLNVRTNLVRNRDKLRSDNDVVNQCLWRWGLTPRGIEGAVSLTSGGLPKVTAYSVAHIAERWRGQELLLSEPVVIDRSTRRISDLTN